MGCFSPFPHGTCPLSVFGWYLALPDGPGCFGRDSSCPALLRARLAAASASRTGLSPPAARLSMRFRSLPPSASPAPLLPPPLSLAATRGITVVFFSCGYWDVSVPRVGPAATAAVRGSRRVGSPIRTPPDLRPFAPPRGFSQPVASFFAPRSQGIRRTPLILSFWLSFILSLCSLPLLLFAVFLLPPCQ